MKLKETEIRIGNKLLFLGNEITVECISNLPKRKDMYWIKPIGMIESKIMHFSGVPLTVDNLEWLGFKYDESTHTYHWKHSHWLRVQMFPKGGGILLINGRQYRFLDYVHEVQNVFSALLKEEI